MSLRDAAGVTFDTHAPLLIVGAGAAGLCAALAAKEAGVDPVVIERDALPSGSTALSAGLIPAAGTRFQRAKGIDDSADRFADDIQRKADGGNDPAIVKVVARESSALIEWLADCRSMPFDVVDNFNYPGHSALRMHGLPSRSGRELIDRLRSAAEADDIVILTESVVDDLYVGEGGVIRGIGLTRADGRREMLGCDALILACNGYGGDAGLVRRFIPEMAEALYFGHPGNRGDAVRWGEALGAELRYLSAYQGHGSVATPHNILITWAVIMQGGFQVNRDGRRFGDESHGYSEQAADVLRQPGGVAFDVFDDRVAAVARQFEDFQAAERGGAVLRADSMEALAVIMKVPADALAVECSEVEAVKAANGHDRFGRRFAPEQRLAPPYCAVKVTGALFHTQGGLAIDANARVLRKDGSAFPNLFAAGGAAAGVSGDTAAGYLSGNGLLTATTLGRLAGRSAARLIGKTYRS
ncbi:FAD-dependent oxidoreductase [Pseudolabrys sp. FHR47]|uniref:FAD-dependent oxidoreductase n=1 Tax=Pseudolabrys sp. FHR47 TaxID=2562284 RepID=UPI0010BEBF29|nr:FAD-dependent oxidoreductase [Pseudolabrys sp. FHR47]